MKIAKTTLSTIIVTAIVSGTIGLVGCTPTQHYHETVVVPANQVATDDTAITTQIKSNLSADAKLKNCSFTVETINGNVTLSGLVNYPYQEKRAIATVRNTPGVISVTDKVMVKKRQVVR